MVRVDVITSDSRFTVCEQGLQGYEIGECKVTVQLNAVSSAVIKVPPTNTHIQPLTSGISPVIAIYDNERLEFIGSIASHKTDLWGNVEIQLDGALSWLSDIVKPPFYVDNKSHAEYIEAIIGQYNNAMVANGTEERIIEFGGVVGFFGLVDIHHSDEYVNTLNLLREAVEMYGGYFFETFGDGVAHPAVGWIREPIVDSGVVIEFGVNELALESQLDFSDFATRVYAVGKTSNITYLASAPDLELEYGRRDYAIKTDAEDQNTLAVQAHAVLNARKIPVRIIEVTAAELGLMGQRADALEIGSTATLLDRKLGDDVVLMVNTIERDLIDRQNTRISLGRSPVTITGVVSSGGSSSSVQSSGGGAISIPDAVLFTPQNLTPSQQSIARNNIGVGSGGEAVVNLPFVTPEDYGAVGDGVTDDTQAIQSALNSGSLVLCAENLIYLVSSSLQISGGTILDMNGSTFRTESDIPIIVENQNNSAVSKIVIRNGYFSGTRSDGDGSSFTNQCGIRIRSFQSVYDNLRFDNFNYGIYLDARSTGTGTLVENRILNCKFANCMNAAIYNETGTKVTDGILNNVKIGGTGYDHGIYFKQAGGWQISNLHIYGADLTIGAEFRNCDATLLSNIYIGGNHSTAGLILHDYSHVELSNAVIQANTARTNGLWAQTSTSHRWEKKPILLSNVVFSSNAAAGSEIFAIRGGGDIQTVNVIYNDQFGAFVDSRIEPTEQDPSHVVKEAKVDEFGYDIYYPIDNGKELTNNKDFNTIVEPGNYIVTKSAVAQSAVNIPEVANGRLVVSNPTGTNGTNRYRRQEYRTYSTTNAIAYERYGTSSDGGETWSWRPWVAVRDSLSTAVAISSGDDLNNYTNPGAFLVRTSQVAQNTTNMPIVLPGRLFVMDMLNGYARGESSVYLRQFFIPYATASGTWTRYGVYSSGVWTWHEWQAEQRAPVTVWEVQDASQGLIALNTNISSNLAWQLTGLNLSSFKRIKIYAKAGRKTGAMAADSSIVPAVIIEMLLDDRAKETVSQNVFIGSAVVQNPNDANRLGMLTCAVSADKTKFAVTRATSLYGTAATSNTDCYQYVFKIEGYYD